MELKGKIKLIKDRQTFASGFEKQELILVTDEQYPQPISIEFLQDKTELLDVLKVGDEVTVSINIRGREWAAPSGEVKYFNSIVGWRVEKTGSSASSHAANNPPPATAREAFFDDDEFGY